MDNRSFVSGASATPPTAPASPSVGHPTDGNPTLAIPATLPGDYWFYQIGEELRAAIVAGGLTPAAGTLNQLATAIFRAKSLAVNGYQTLQSGLIIQWGSGSYAAAGSGGTVVTLPIAFPTLTVTVIAGKADSTGGSVSAITLSNSQIQIYPAAAGSCFWLAIGY